MFSKEISFNEVPQAVAHLITKVERIESLLTAEKIATEPEDRWLNIRELRAYHPDRPAAATVYVWVRRRMIPNHKHGKKLMFLKSEIDAWLKSGKRKTMLEIEDEAVAYCKGKRNKI